MLFRLHKVHKGIILLRCEPNNYTKRIEVLNKLLTNFSEKLSKNFVVVTNDKVRIIESF
jgi:hypothetical protein